MMIARRGRRSNHSSRVRLLHNTYAVVVKVEVLLKSSQLMQAAAMQRERTKAI